MENRTMFEDLENKKIVLYGRYQYCLWYYYAMRENMDIVAIMYSNEPKKEVTNVIPVQEFDAKTIREMGYYIITCDRFLDHNSSDELFHSLGFIYGKDYRDGVFYFYRYLKKMNLPRDISDKELWIYGAGINGRFFCEQYGKDFVAGFISNYADERECMGKPVCRLEDVIGRENIYIVICSEAAGEMEQELRAYGKKLFWDFSYPHLLPKKVVVGVGNCNVDIPLNMLAKIKAYAIKIETLLCWETVMKVSNYANTMRMMEFGKIADFFVYEEKKGIVQQLVDYDALAKDCYLNAKKISYLGTFDFSALYPQIGTANSNYQIKFESGMTLYCYEDTVITSMIDNNYTEDQIIERITSEDCFSKEEIIKHFNKELKKIKLLERNSGNVISGFIEENYKERWVVKDTKHFSSETYYEIAKRLAKEIGIICNEDIQAFMDLEREIHIPIYPSVAKALELEYINEDTRYVLYNEFKEIEYLSFEEFQRRYIRYVKAVKEIQKETGHVFGILPFRN